MNDHALDKVTSKSRAKSSNYDSSSGSHVDLSNKKNTIRFADNNEYNEFDNVNKSNNTSTSCIYNNNHNNIDNNIDKKNNISITTTNNNKHSKTNKIKREQIKQMKTFSAMSMFDSLLKTSSVASSSRAVTK